MMVLVIVMVPMQRNDHDVEGGADNYDDGDNDDVDGCIVAQ